jgi:dTDP-4-amino-4,6-dideoxygalactose transaminase
LVKDRKERDSILEYTSKNNVMTRPAWTPMHSLEMYKNCQKTDLKNTIWLEERLINIPSSVVA